jgi:hypothetical protein
MMETLTIAASSPIQTNKTKQAVLFSPPISSKEQSNQNVFNLRMPITL